MPKNELEVFLELWDQEAANTVKLLKSLPATQYDFRPDPGGRSLGELAWHLAEGDAYISWASSADSSRWIPARRTSSGRAKSTRWRRATSACTTKPSRGFESSPRRSRSHDSVFHRTENRPRNPVECGHRSRYPPSRPADADESTGRRHVAGPVRSEPRGNGGDARGRRRGLGDRVLRRCHRSVHVQS